jgi:hypothetical protein
MIEKQMKKDADHRSRRRFWQPVQKALDINSPYLNLPQLQSKNNFKSN